MTVIRAAAVQLSPVLYSREGTVERVVPRPHLHERLEHSADALPEYADVSASNPTT